MEILIRNILVGLVLILAFILGSSNLEPFEAAFSVGLLALVSNIALNYSIARKSEEKSKFQFLPVAITLIFIVLGVIAYLYLSQANKSVESSLQGSSTASLTKEPAKVTINFEAVEKVKEELEDKNDSLIGEVLYEYLENQKRLSAIIEANRKANEEANKALDLKKRESFKKGEELFCQNNQIISKKSGWVLNGDLFIKDDRYYDFHKCFLKSE